MDAKPPEKLTDNPKAKVTACLLMIAALLIVAGSQKSGSNLSVQAAASVTYQPPMLPIVCSLDANRQISVAINGQAQTPIGIFGISQSIATVKPRYLVVRAGSTESRYQLQQDSRYSVAIPNERDGLSIVHASEDLIRIEIPNPVKKVAIEPTLVVDNAVRSPKPTVSQQPQSTVISAPADTPVVTKFVQTCSCYKVPCRRWRRF